jgi:acyl-homoserine lactone acylase PvdQ
MDCGCNGNLSRSVPSAQAVLHTWNTGGGGVRSLTAALAVAVTLGLAAPAAAAPEPEPYRANDFGGFRDVLPPGANGLANPFQLGQFLSTGQRPAHNDDQLPMYRDLVYASPRLARQDIGRFFKDSSFGVRPEDVERTYSPRDDVTVVRDRFGVPHIYGATRQGAQFGLGYATAEDRLFFMDIFRHLGRAQLSSFAGGAPANREFDAQIWSVAPYTEDDLQRQIDQRPPAGFEQQTEVLREDLTNYVAGINHYIGEARLNPAKMPGEYAAIGRPQGPEDWKGTDAVATAAVIGAIFGAGGGKELQSALVLEEATRRFGKRAGERVWADFRSAEDPEAPTTVHDKRFTYQPRPKRPRGVALPDRGSVKSIIDLDPSTAKARADAGASGAGAAASPGAPGILPRAAFPAASSNALMVSRRESESGRPIAVFGPQTGYFAPQDLMEQDVHAPGLEARGVGFPGANLYVSLGHGRDYAWSATTAAQDLTDTFAVPLCEPGGGKASTASMHYAFRGQCRPIEVLERTNSWQPNLADPTPAGSETLRSERTALGLVIARGTVKGRPVAYTRLRVTYFHETDSSLALSFFNDPSKIRGPRDFQKAAYLISYAFNWFYVDDRSIAYLNGGLNPVRARKTDPNFPVSSELEWKDFDPGQLRAAATPIGQRAQVVDQRFITSWNNKQARGTRAADGNWGYGSTYRSKPLDDRIRRGIRGRAKMTLEELIDAMEDAGTVDLRGDAVLPWALKVIGRSSDPTVRAAVGKLRAWNRAGSHRRDRTGDGTYEHAEAIRIMDAWWPVWMRAQFRPALGSRLFDRIVGMIEFDNSPNNHGQHLGSAYQAGWYGYAHKDLRTLLGKRVRGRYSRVYCGKGVLARCRKALEGSLKIAVAGADPARLYGGDEVCAESGQGLDPQWCYDAVWFRPLGGITQPLIHWINRPTYQQVVEVEGHRPR